jgi:thermitase
MKHYLKTISIFVSVLFFCAILFLSPQKVFSQSNNQKISSSIISGQYIITFNNTDGKNKFDEQYKNSIVNNKNIGPNTYSYKIIQDLLSLNIATGLNANNGIKAIETDHEIHASIIPNDTNYGSQWNLPVIQAPAGWDVTQGSASTTIAVIDTGMQLNHPDLSAKYVGGYDFVNSDNNPTDDNGHGTETAGIIAAVSNNSIGVAGVNWNAKIMALKVLDSTGSGYESDLIAAINYAVTNGANIINMSLGSTGYTQALQTAVTNAYNAGVVLIAASGNTPYCTVSGTVGVNYPAALNGVIAVGSSSSTDVVSSFSCSGPQVAVVAPGENIYSTKMGSTYGNAGSGTSFSTPQVAGLASLILSKYPGVSPSFVENMIISGATKVSGMGSNNFTNYYGYGRIDIPTSLFKIVKSSTSPLVYIISNGYKEPVKSDLSFSYYNVSWSDLETISQSILDSLPTGPAIGFLTKGSSPAVYLVSNNQKFWAPSYDRMQMWGYTWNDIQTIPDATLNRVSDGGDMNILVKSSSSPTVYALVGYASYVSYPDVWNGWAFNWSWLRTIDDATLAVLPKSSQLSRLIKGSGPAIYFMDNGQKRLITNWNMYQRFSATYGTFSQINDGLLNEIVTGPNQI